MAFQRIIAADGDKERVLAVAKGAGLIADSVNCAPCGRAMKWTVDSKVKDGYRWRCGKCRRERTARELSFFQDSNVSIPYWIRAVNVWCQNERFTIDDVRAAAHVARSTAKSMVKAIREMCDRVVFEDTGMFVGGVGVPVVIVLSGAMCNARHPVLFLFDGTKLQLVHNQATLPIQDGSTVFSDVQGVDGLDVQGERGTAGRQVEPCPG